MKFSNTEVQGFESALRGMRNPLNSWDKSDSGICKGGSDGIGCENCALECECTHAHDYTYKIGKSDMKLAQSLINSGSEHYKFLRMIQVWVDIDMPRYWWSEMDTYHFNVKNSCSTMHKLLNNTEPITLETFEICDEDIDWWLETVCELEKMRQHYKRIQSTTKNQEELNRLLLRAKRMLPEGFLQMRTVNTNYAELRNIYFQRKNHRLKEEWVDTFCKWIESLPYSKQLIMYEGGTKV